MARFLGGLAAVILWGLSIGVAMAQTYSYTTFAYPGASVTIAFGVNDSGVVVGSYCVPPQMAADCHGFSYQAGVFTTIDVPGSTDTNIYAISNDGMMVGSYYRDKIHVNGFVLQNGVFHTTPDTPYYTVISAISSNDEAVGTIGAAADQCITYKAGIFRTLKNQYSAGCSGVNASGTIVGTVNNSNLTLEAFVYSHRRPRIFGAPGFKDTYGVGVNDAGTVIGTIFNGTLERGFATSNGTARPFNFPSAYWTSASAINQAGDIVGSYDMAGNVGDFGYIDHQGTFTTMAPSGAFVSRAAAINSLGQVVGDYLPTQSQVSSDSSFLATPLH